MKPAGTAKTVASTFATQGKKMTAFFCFICIMDHQTTNNDRCTSYMYIQCISFCLHYFTHNIKHYLTHNTNTPWRSTRVETAFVVVIIPSSLLSTASNSSSVTKNWEQLLPLYRCERSPRLASHLWSRACMGRLQHTSNTFRGFMDHLHISTVL